jgi:hypothetical protein
MYDQCRSVPQRKRSVLSKTATKAGKIFTPTTRRIITNFCPNECTISLGAASKAINPGGQVGFEREKPQGEKESWIEITVQRPQAAKGLSAKYEFTKENGESLPNLLFVYQYDDTVAKGAYDPDDDAATQCTFASDDDELVDSLRNQAQSYMGVKKPDP